MRVDTVNLSYVFTGAKSVAMVVDDGELIRMLIGEMLSDAGFEVLLFQSAEEALAAAPQACPTLVLTDLRLGTGMSGIDLLREIALILPDTQRILMSAGFDSHTLRATDYRVLAKPFSRADLLKSVRAV